MFMKNRVNMLNNLYSRLCGTHTHTHTHAISSQDWLLHDALTHLYWETVNTGRSHTGQSGHCVCQRRGTGSLAQGTRGNGEQCETARNLENGQRAESLQDAWKHTLEQARKHIYAHTRANKHKDCKNLSTKVVSECYRGQSKQYQAVALWTFPLTLICLHC